MKKSFLAIFAAFGLAFSVSAQEQEQTAAPEAEAAAAEKLNTESFNHWSIAVKGGIDYLRGSDQKVDWELGGVVERTFNPRWGMGIEYMFLHKNQDAFARFSDMKAQSHDISFFGSANISNIIAPYRSAGWQKLNLYGLGGLGASIGRYKIADAEDFDSKAKMLFWAGADLEYNVCKWIGIFLEGQYRWHTNNTFIGRNAYGRSFGSANLGVRLKFAGESNIRNIAWADYVPQIEVPDFAGAFEAQKNEIMKANEQLAQQVADQNEQIKKLQNQVKFTQDSLDSHIFRTKKPKRYTPTAEEKSVIQTALANLEFETGKATIKEASFSYLDGLAVLLKSHKEWSIQLKGYTDNVGNKDKNIKLSKDRAAAVADYLIKKGVDSANIESEGYGAANPIASNNTAAGRAKNRRVEVEMFSK